MLYTKDYRQIRNMSLEQVITNMLNDIYDVLYPIQVLETIHDKMKIEFKGFDGNGHHIRQKIASLAIDKILDYWHDKDEADKLRKDV